MRREFPTVASAWVCGRSRGCTDLELRQDQGHFAITPGVPNLLLCVMGPWVVRGLDR